MTDTESNNKDTETLSPSEEAAKEIGKELGNAMADSLIDMAEWCIERPYCTETLKAIKTARDFSDNIKDSAVEMLEEAGILEPTTEEGTNKAPAQSKETDPMTR